MKKIFKVVILILLPSVLFAGAWTQKRNGGYFRLDFRWLNADKFHDNNGNNIEIPTLGDYTQSLYAEYGITNWLTVQTYIPIYKIARADVEVLGEKENTGIGDVNLGVKVLLKKFHSSVLSAGLSVGLPFGDSSPTGGLILGDGEYNQALSLQYGYSFYPVPGYFNVGVKYNNRNAGYSDEVYFSGEFGYSIKESFGASVKAVYLKSVENGSDNLLGGYAGLYANNQEYITVTPELIYKLCDNMGVAANAGFGLTAKNIMNAVVYSVGIFLTK